MPRKSKRNRSKRNVSTIVSSSQQSYQRTSQVPSQDKPSGKGTNEAFGAYNKLSSINYSRCSFLPGSCKLEHEPSLPSQCTKSPKSNSIKISSPRGRSSGKVSSHSGSSKRPNTARTTAQSFQKYDTGSKKDKTEKGITKKEKSDIKSKHHEKDQQRVDKKARSEKSDAKSTERLRPAQKEAIEKKFIIEKDKDEVYPTGNTASNTGLILGWEKVKMNGNRGSRQSSTKIVSTAPVRLTAEISPLANNRFYELSNKPPDKKESRHLRAHQGAIPKRKITSHGTTAQAKDDSFRTFLTSDAQGGQKRFQAKKSTDLFGTYLNVDGTRSQITNWRRNVNLGPIWEPNSMAAQRRILPPSRPIVILPPAPLRRIESYCNFYKKSNRQNCSVTNVQPKVATKVAPLRNLCEPGREIWVNKQEYANSNSLQCVKILPSHHKCAGVERRLTPNDADVEKITSKLEQHERLPKPGTRSPPCTCFRDARRSFCTNCKTNLIGRPFRKCRKHPDIGFSTDHYYCPFCLADAMLLKEL